MKHKQHAEKDYGQDLFHSLIFLILLAVVLWYFKV